MKLLKNRSVGALSQHSPLPLMLGIDSFDIESIFSNDWESSEYVDRYILNSVIEGRGLIFKIVGAFDDQESGFVGFGMPELVTELALSCYKQCRGGKTRHL